MKKTFGDLKKLVLEHLREKSFSFSGGTVVFLAFNLLMITGFCKFSFYVLKNHRSAIERDSLIRTYVDVQPQITDRKKTSSYFSLASQDKTAPAPFFIKREETEIRHPSVHPNNAAPLPVLNDSSKQDVFPVTVARTIVRPPVIKKTVALPITPAESAVETEVTVKEETSPAVSLDTLMASGLDLLDQSEKTAITASEHFLQEDEVPAETSSVAFKNIPAAPLSVVRDDISSGKKAEAPAPVQAAVAERKLPKETRWVDVAELRRRLADELLKKNEMKSQNTALLEMNDAKQVAALETETVSDVSESVPVKKEAVETAEIKSETQPSSETKQVAVVQDIPFSEMTSPSETARKTESVSSPVNSKKALAGNSPELWKVAEVKGKNQKSSKKPAKASLSETLELQEKTVSEEKPPSAKPDMIYRNGKAVAIVQQPEKKTLNWLDRQEAAVWTSMSQSDTPSVWSADMETKTASSEKARAFRVADEQPVIPAKEDNKEKEAAIRPVTASSAPEAKENPILLPLGASNAPATPFAESAKKDEQNEDGLMNKLFSFFGKTDTPEDTSPLSSGSSVKMEQQPQSIPAFSGTGAQNIKAFKTGSNPFGVKTQTDEKQIVPTEMRLTFKPDSTEMSVQSIKWIKALGQKAKKDIQNAIEVRMSTTDPVLQNKRFAIIRSTLLGVGVEEIQILPISTDRTPHTIVLRMIVLPEEGYTEYTTENNGVKERMYYKQW